MSKFHVATYQRVIHNGVSVAQHFTQDMPKFSKDVVIRLGGTMPYNDYEIQINSAEAVKNSVNKLAQKNLLLKAGLTTLPLLNEPVYPCVIKALERSGGVSVFIINNEADFIEAVAKVGKRYLLEPLFKATGEYRLHCTRTKCFFSVKKHKRNPEDIIINRDNHFNKMAFVKPRLWQEIQDQCIKAMTVLDLDIAAFDVIYDSSNNAQHRFTIAEANTNPELLHNTYNAYKEVLIELINDKIEAATQKRSKPAKYEPVPEAVEVEKPRAKPLTAVQKVALMEAVVNGNYFVEQDGTTVTIKL